MTQFGMSGHLPFILTYRPIVMGEETELNGQVPLLHDRRMLRVKSPTLYPTGHTNYSTRGLRLRDYPHFERDLKQLPYLDGLPGVFLAMRYYTLNTFSKQIVPESIDLPLLGCHLSGQPVMTGDHVVGWSVSLRVETAGLTPLLPFAQGFGDIYTLL